MQVLPALESGGVERGTIEVARAAVQAGFVALVASEGGRLVKQLEAVGAKHITLPLATKSPLGIRRNAKLLAGIIEDHKVDIVHARSRAPAWSAYKAAKKTGVHFLTTFHGVYSYKTPFKKHYNSVMAKGEKVIAISKFIADHLTRNYGVPEERIRLIYRGVDMEYFDPAKVTGARMQALRDKWRLTEDWPVILMPGRITRWKGQDFLLDALSRFKEERQFYCVMCGDATGHEDYYKELRDYVMRYGLEKKVRLEGNVDDMPAAYKLARLVVSASKRPEAFGRVIVEAQAMGIPVVATDIGGSRETVKHGETGRLVDSGYTKEMSEGIMRGLMIGEDDIAELSAKTREHVRENFSLDSMCSKTIALYREILGETTATPVPEFRAVDTASRTSGAGNGNGGGESW